MTDTAPQDGPVLPELTPSHPRNGAHVVTRLAPDAPVLDRHG